MKAVIMAGGQGTRLRPLTCDTPKPLCTLLGKPVILYILELLKAHGVTAAAVTLGYQGVRLEAALRDYEEMELSFSHEQKPLGTAGGVKNALGEACGDVVVISGDAMCDFDLSAALRYHQEKKAAATIVVKRVEDPREYGLVEADQEGRVTAFVEKPSYAGCTTDLANTGVYLLSPKVLSLIEPGQAMDFAKDVFPRMLDEGMPIYSLEDKGYWCDIGDLKSYLRCQADMLEGKVRFHTDAELKEGALCAGRLPQGRYEIRPPVYIGRDVTIGDRTVIGPHTVLLDDVQLGEDSQVTGSVLQAGVTVGDRVSLSRMIACEKASFEHGSGAEEYSAAGADAQIGREAVLAEGARVWPQRTVEAGARLSEDLLQGSAQELLIGDDGITGQTNVVVTPALCTRLGSGVASFSDFPVVGVGYGGRTGSGAAKNAAQMLALSCMSGVMAAGANVWDFGECMESQFAFCMTKSQVDFGIYIDSGPTTQIRVSQRGGLPLRREYERKLESALNRREYKRASPGGTGSKAELCNLSKLYPFELLKLCDAPLDGLSVTVKSTSRAAKEILEEVLSRLGCKLDGPLMLLLSPDGKVLSLSGEGLSLSPERLLATICLSEFLKGESVALPRSAPRIIERLARENGGQVLRYSECPTDGQDEAARQKAASHPWPRDGLMQAVKALSFMAAQRLCFSDFCRLTPEFSVSTRLVEIEKNPSAVVRRLRERLEAERETKGRARVADGLELTFEGASAYLRPTKSGRGITILSESFQSETAMELCDRFEAAVKNVLQEEP